MIKSSTESNEGAYDGPTPDRDAIKAATKRIQLILDTNPHLLDDQSMVVSTNDELDAAQTYIRDDLGLAYPPEGAGGNPDHPILGMYEGLTPRLMRRIHDDLTTIWADEFSRDTISEWAMQLSLCPLHFCDWMSCFDDEDDDCAAIRAIFPHSHDT